MTQIISITGNRGSGKTSMAIHLANSLDGIGVRIVLFIQGPRAHIDHVRRYINSRYIKVKSYEEDLRWFREYNYDYVIYDGQLSAETTQHYNLSPIIDEEIIKRYSQ